MNLDVLASDDAGAALELSSAQGWNQTLADWGRLIELEPAGCFGVRHDKRLIGTVTTTTYGRSLAWIGMMIVDPEFRRQGLGSTLMRHALEYLQGAGVTCIKLDATPAGQPLYESLGFDVEGTIERWKGVARAGTNPEIVPSESLDLVAPKVLDAGAYAADRSRLLARLAADGDGPPLVVAHADGTPQGYAFARAGRAASYVGPVVGRAEGVCTALLEAMLTRLDGQEVYVDLHLGGHVGPSWFERRGFSKQRSLARMRLGVDNGAGTAQAVCASAGPEFG